MKRVLLAVLFLLIFAPLVACAQTDVHRGNVRVLGDFEFRGNIDDDDGLFNWDDTDGRLEIGGSELSSDGESRVDITTTSGYAYNHGIRIQAGQNSAELIHGYNEDEEHIIKINANSDKGGVLQILGDGEDMHFHFGTPSGGPYAVFGGDNTEREGSHLLTVLGTGYFTGLSIGSSDSTDWDLDESDDFDGAYASLTGVPAEFNAGSIKTITVDDTDIADGKALVYNAATGNLEYETNAGGGGVTDHGALTGLTDDDHDGIYFTESEITALLAGKSDTTHNHDGTYELADATILKQADVDDTPVDGVTNAPISSNWAYDHGLASNPHGGAYYTESEVDDLIAGFNALTNWSVGESGGDFYITKTGTGVTDFSFSNLGGETYLSFDGDAGALAFYDSGVHKWNLGTDTDQSFDLFDTTAGINIFSAVPDGNMNLWPRGDLTIYRIANVDFDINFNSGVTSTEAIKLIFQDQGTDKWDIRKTTDNHLAIYDYVASDTVFEFEDNGALNLSPATGTLNFSHAGGTTGTANIEVGTGQSGNHYSYVDLIGDTTYSDYGARFIRGNTGANTNTGIYHRGTGELFLNAYDAGAIKFYVNNSLKQHIESDGDHTFYTGGTFRIDREADGASNFIMDSGSTSAQAKLMYFQDRGSNEWYCGVNSVGDFVFYDSDASSMALRMYDNAGIAITPAANLNIIPGGSKTYITGGVIVGSPTGDYKGAGTINAQAVYDDNVLLTDYVFDAAVDGEINAAQYDLAVPDRAFRDENGTVKRIEQRGHRPAREFKMEELEPREFARKWKETRKLPAIARAEDSAVDENGTLSLGETLQALVETCEVYAVHIENLETRISELEAKVEQLEKRSFRSN